VGRCREKPSTLEVELAYGEIGVVYCTDA